MTGPLFAVLPGPIGPLRALLDARCRDLAEQGVERLGPGSAAGPACRPVRASWRYVVHPI